MMEAITKPQPSEWDQNDTWDSSWAHDWYNMGKLFGEIESLKKSMHNIEMPFVHRISTKQIILNLEKFAYSLSKVIAKKYS